MKLKEKVIKGGFYLALTNILQQFTAIVVNIVLARLLLPSDFGLIAISSTYIGFVTIFTKVGFGSAIIHDQESTQEQLSSLYWINFILSLSTFLIVVGTAPWAASFYREPRLKMVVSVLALNILITPFFITHSKILERDIEFKLLSRINLATVLVGAVVGVAAAFVGFGVYALVAQTLSSTVTRLALILRHSDWNPKWILRLAAIKPMLWYSVKYKLSSSVLYVDRNIDYLVLGKIFSPVILGYYAFAYNIMYTPVKRISYIFTNILFPSFSAIRNDHQKLIFGYFRSMRMIAMISFPAMVILSFNAAGVINFVFGPKWNDALPIVQVLCFAGAIQSVSQLGGVIFPSIGKPEVSMYVGVTRTVLTVGAILIGAMHGILAVAYLLVAAKLISFMVLLFVINLFVHFRIRDLFEELTGPILTVIVLVVIEGGFRLGMIPEYSLVKLMVMAFATILCTWVFNKKVIMETIAIIRKRN